MKRGTGRAGEQRWSCGHKRNGTYCWNGHNPVGVESAEAKGIDTATVKKLHRKLKFDKRDVKRYVITSAQNATPINKAFFASLLTYCKHKNAQLVVIPYRYKNPTAIWSKKANSDDWWAPELAPYILDQRWEINRHLVVLGDIKTQPTASSPLQGFETISGSRSAIIGHPKLELKTVATPGHKLPKIITTTGAVTVMNYLQTKAGKKGEHHHTFGACVLEQEGELFHMRQINAIRNGSFMDMEWEYSGDDYKRVPRAAALVMGDTHVKFVDPQVVKATFGNGGIIDSLKPEVLVWHDVFDCYSGSHHDRDKAVINYVKHHSGAGNVSRELMECFTFMDEHTPAHTKNVVVPSNHPNDHLWRWVNDTDPKKDPENAIFWAQSYVAMCQLSRMGTGGASTLDIFSYWGKQWLKHQDTVFLHQDESFFMLGVEMGFHGHVGPNGARGTRKAFGKIGVKTFIGHAHSPGIEDGVYQVGTSSRLRLSYNRGPSSWLHTHGLLYKNGKRTLINIIDGRYKA